MVATWWADTQCGCRHGLPLRFTTETVRLLLTAPRDTVILTYRCRRCGDIPVTVGQLTPPTRRPTPTRVLLGGGGGGCPVLVLGIKPNLYVED